MTKKRSIEGREAMGVIHESSVAFWEFNKEICKYENLIATKNALARAKQRLYKVKDIRV